MTKLLIVVILCSCFKWSVGNPYEYEPKYSNIWVAKIKGGENVARRIAKDHGYAFNGQCGQFEDYYELVKEDHPEVSLRDSSHLTDNILDLDEVVWAKQQKLVRPMTLDWPFTSSLDELQGKMTSYVELEARRQVLENKNCKSVFSCISKFPSSFSLFSKRTGQKDFSTLGTISTKPAPASQLHTYSKVTTQHIGLTRKKLSAYAIRHNDPYWKYQWNMQDYRTQDMPVMDINVVPVHKMGITGNGIIVSVIDNGVDETNFEFKDNFIKSLSYDMCKNIPGSKPKKHSHGTNCAGVIAMQPDNKKCGVGIAYNAKIVGVRAICDKEQTQHTTSKALRHSIENIDISSNSWGLVGFGTLFFERDHLTDEAYLDGVTKGRGGKGVIFVRSSGNDKDEGDHCDVDPEINSPYVITIAGADQNGQVAYYSEPCTAIFATTYTQSGYSEGIVAPNKGRGCTTKFGGTSAACPQASGIIALVLEANRELTYRDVMHLVTMSAEVAPLANNAETWYKNGRGFWVSNDFGFGLMNAQNMVTLAKTWENVPKKRECFVTIKLEEPEPISKEKEADIPFETSACQGSPDEVNYLEHIELSSVVEFPFRGDIMVFITSPSKTRSQLLKLRYKDKKGDGLDGWAITSTHNWGEVPQGTWTVTYKINKFSILSKTGLVKEFTIKFYGTKEMPAHYAKTRTYAAFRLPDGQTS